MNLSFFIHTFFSPTISSNIHRNFNNTFHEFKVLKKIVINETFNVDFHHKFIKIWIICFFFLLFLIYIYIYIIIIILSYHQHGYPWLTLATPYRSSLLTGPQGYIPYSHKATGRPAFARPREGVHRRTSLMSSSLFLQQCPACLVRLTLIVFVMGGRWPYSCFFVGCSLQDLFNIARSILAVKPFLYPFN